jgi:hypothetical protein
MLVCATGILSGCKEEGITPTGEACMGTDNDSLVEGLEENARKAISLRQNTRHIFVISKARLL